MGTSAQIVYLHNIKQKLKIMTKYILKITTYKVGMPIEFHFSTVGEREWFLVTFTNNLPNTDRIIKVVLGETTYAA